MPARMIRDNLRAACSRLKLSVRDEQKKKSGLISVLVSYWNTSKSLVGKNAKSPVPASESPVKTGIESPYDVAQFVQRFPPHGRIEELHSQLDACRSRTLRVACVLLGLEPKKTFTKPDFLDDLVTYWQDSLVMKPTASPLKEAPREKEVEEVHTKRPRVDVPTKSKKSKTLNSREYIFEEKVGAFAASVEKATAVKEWASAIEVLSRVEGSAESIKGIRNLIDRVVDSAIADTMEEVLERPSIRRDRRLAKRMSQLGRASGRRLSSIALARSSSSFLPRVEDDWISDLEMKNMSLTPVKRRASLGHNRADEKKNIQGERILYFVLQSGMIDVNTFKEVLRKVSTKYVLGSLPAQYKHLSQLI